MTGLRIGLVSNALSLGNRYALPDLPSAGPCGTRLLHRAVEGMQGMPEALDDFAAGEVHVIAVNGGDGTVSAVLTELLSHERFERLPMLALLRGGTLNMCAGDAGLAGTAARALARLMRQTDADVLAAAATRRHVIRVQRDGDPRAVCGMFLGLGSLYRAIRYSYDEVPGRQSIPRLHAARTLGSLIGRHLLRGGAADRILRGERVGVAFDDGQETELDLLLAMVTTLDRLVLGFRPYWGQQDGGLHCTLLRDPADRLVRRAFRILYGGPERRLPSDSYCSRNAARLRIGPGLPFAMDGEFYETDPTAWVTLSAAGPLRFVRC